MNLIESNSTTFFLLLFACANIVHPVSILIELLNIGKARTNERLAFMQGTLV